LEVVEASPDVQKEPKQDKTTALSPIVTKQRRQPHCHQRHPASESDEAERGAL